MSSAPISQEARPPAWHAGFAAWVGREPLSAVLLLLNAGALLYFYCFVPLFHYATETTLRWAWYAWRSPEQAHGRLVPLISLYLLWRERGTLRRAAGPGSNTGLAFVAAGVTLFLASARCLEPRIALLALPFLVYGSVLFVWGRAAARVFAFPCALLVFMIPWAAAEQATNRLQFFITHIVGVMSNLCGIHTQAIGTTLVAADGSFRFEIADGCSGVHSLTAITLLTAVFVHVTQKELWKKAAIFASSVVFAILGNVGRIFSVILAAKFAGSTAAARWHEYAGFISFPIAMAAMVGFSVLLNLDYAKFFAAAPQEKRVSFDY